MRIWAFFLAAVICLAVASAVPDSVTLGPCKVSFDLGTSKDAYTIVINEQKESETLGGDKELIYSMNLQNNSHKNYEIIIGLISYTKEQIAASASPSSLKLAMWRAEPDAIDIQDRNIDDKVGIVAEYKYLGQALYMAQYYPNDYLLVTIASSYPWDEGTLALLKTIHVEKA